MKKILLFLVLLSACSQNSPDFMQVPGTQAAKKCPIIQKGQTVAVAKISFEAQSIKMPEDAQAILSEVAEMHRRCGGQILVNGSSLSAEPKDYGYLRAGLVYKELEKQRAIISYGKFTQKDNSTRDVTISFKK
ncbi:MAG: hypothetical protein ACK5MJ_08505 [Alphaproteobacteria bacterium]